KPGRIVAALSLILVVILGISYATQAKPKETETEAGLRKAREEKRLREEEKQRAMNLEDPNVDYEPDPEVREHVKEINQAYPDYILSKADLKKLQGMEGIMIGDSLTEMSETEYSKLMPAIDYDGKVNRQLF